MPRAARTTKVSANQARGYGAKAEEYLEAARENLAQGRHNAATSLAVHAGINAADAITGAQQGFRSASPEHSRAIAVLSASGSDGKDAAKHLARLLPVKTKAEYDPAQVSKSQATAAVKTAGRLVEVARRVLFTLPGSA